ncbi:MAG: hypothetical protein OEW36_13590 [Hylemonella sp.]|nr:hypothetical protein [Hylemonella sp.]
MENTRYLTPSAAGVLPMLGRNPADEERRLFEYFLMAARPQVIDMAVFGEALDLPLATIARIMFSLNRSQSISVLDQPPSARVTWETSGLSGLADDLAALALPGQKLLLSTADGFCVARVGWSSYEADVMATREPTDISPSLGEIFPIHHGSSCFYLSANARIDQKNTALLNLGHRLLLGCLTPAVQETC